MQDPTLAHRLELWGFEDGVMVFRDFSLGMALAIQPIDVACQSDESINTLKQQIRQFLNGLESGVTLQFVQRICPGNNDQIARHQNARSEVIHPLVSDILDSRVKKYSEFDARGELPKQKLFLFIRKPFRSGPSRTWKKRSKVLREDTLRLEIDEFKRVLESATSGLNSLGVMPTALSDQEVFSLVYRQWNPDRPLPSNTLTNHDVRDQICLTDAVVGPDYFLLGNVYHKVVSLKNLPDEHTFASMVDELQKLPFESTLHFSIDVLDQNKEISSLQLQRRMAYASVFGKTGVSDLDARAKLNDIESVLEEMIQGSEKVFKISLNVVLKNTDLGVLDFQVMETLQLLRTMNGAEGMLETVAAFDVFTELALPNAKARERAMKVNTSVAADLVPLYGNWAGFENPSVLLRTKDGSLFTFDPFAKDLTNSNMIVSGGSGAGKSFFANSLISQMLKENPKVFILDVGASYKRTCENLGGQYIELGLKSNLSINPFSLDGVDAENMDRKIKFLVTLVELMTKEPGKTGISRLERAEIERLVKIVLEEPEPRLSRLMEKLLLSNELEIKRLGRILGLWCGDAPYGKFVDRPTTVKLDRNIVCFDLKGLEDNRDLQSVCLFIITDLIWREVQKDRTHIKL